MSLPLCATKNFLCLTNLAPFAPFALYVISSLFSYLFKNGWCKKLLNKSLNRYITHEHYHSYFKSFLSYISPLLHCKYVQWKGSGKALFRYNFEKKYKDFLAFFDFTKTLLFLPMKKVYFWQLFQCNVYKKLVLNLHFFTAFLLQKIENFSIVIFTFFSLLKKQVKVVNLALISCKDYNKKLAKMAIFSL